MQQCQTLLLLSSWNIKRLSYSFCMMKVFHWQHSQPKNEVAWVRLLPLSSPPPPPTATRGMTTAATPIPTYQNILISPRLPNMLNASLICFWWFAQYQDCKYSLATQGGQAFATWDTKRYVSSQIIGQKIHTNRMEWKKNYWTLLSDLWAKSKIVFSCWEEWN